MEWAFGPEGDVGLGLDLAGRSLRLMQELSLVPELRRWSEAALVRVGEAPPAVEARLWLGKAYTYNQFNDPQQAGLALRAASLFEKAGDRQAQAVAFARAGASLMTNARTAESEPLLHQAHDLLQPFGPSKHLAACLHYIGVCHFFAGDGAAAGDLIEAGSRDGTRTRGPIRAADYSELSGQSAVWNRSSGQSCRNHQGGDRGILPGCPTTAVRSPMQAAIWRLTSWRWGISPRHARPHRTVCARPDHWACRCT